ncbi:MAG: bifunctional UDP-N-acetylmuramoyl-tripeptide:D-alanyl-D-alanine ligase/alanine racemase [Bacteroidales bacterium]|nr:MAG: bifunctional UDP-N-acetylmuramoyl-tripeptide:D-alanyl-D-alanine ligase/alanine racemase [Bacteroidales bacterium]
MLNYPVLEITNILNAKQIGKTDRTIKSVSIDSRSIAGGENVLFFALIGQHHDGHLYITDLYNYHGVKAFVVSKTDSYLQQFPEATFIHVPDTLQALQKLASYHRSRFTYPVLGITGSNGKTIVKEWLSQLLSTDYRVVRSPKSFNSQVGVPLSILQMDETYQIGLFEAGISLPHEMEKLESIIAPDYGILTNIGNAHQENFEDQRQKAIEKIKLFANTKQIIYCKDHSLIDSIFQQKTPKNTFTWGHSPNADVQIKSITIKNGSTTIRLCFKGEDYAFSIPFTDSASVENAMHCYCFMLLLGIEAETISSRMERLIPVAMRLELKEGVNNCTLINDSYNSDIGSLSIALDFLLQQKQHPQRILILSDILQSGQSPKVLYTEVARLISEKRVDKLIGIGKDIGEFANLFKVEKEFFSNTNEFLDSFSRRQIFNSAILLKGSRTFHFERISAVLERKAHRTVMEVNLNALEHNLNYFRSLLKPNVKVMALVKAFSYGSGSYEIANLLQFHRIDYLGVAFADEGVSLREAGITLPIIVLNPSFGTYELMIEYNLEPEIFNFSGLNEFVEILGRSGVDTYPIHLKIDSGMHRLGFTSNEVDELIAKLKGCPSIKVQSIFSHLASSEDCEHDSFTQEQIYCFSSICDQISKSIGYSPIRHILNSAGIERFPLAHFDMVRLGIGLYGVSSVDQTKLQNVSTLKTHVIQVKHLTIGETVGYNRKGVITKPSTIITIPIGYADGLNRKLSNGCGQFLLKGQLVPTIGNVSMDTCLLDATGVDVKEGDEVVIFGKNPTIFDLAKAIETIPYEVLTSISRRVKRVYFQE